MQDPIVMKKKAMITNLRYFESFVSHEFQRNAFWVNVGV